MRLINTDKLEIDVCYARNINKVESIYDYSYSEKQIQNAPAIKAIPVEWIEMFMQRYKIEGGNEYKLLHFMVTEWKKWEKENEQ